MLVSAESQVPKLISREITLRNSNACDHNPPTLQTGGQTERQTTMAIPRYATLRAVKRDHSVRRQQRQAMLIACALPAHRHPPASQCSRWPNVNERTNQPTNKHDGSQWIGLYLLLEITRRTTFTLSPSWQSHCQSSHGSRDECRPAPGGCRSTCLQTVTLPTNTRDWCKLKERSQVK